MQIIILCFIPIKLALSEPNNTLMRALTDAEKLEFLSKYVSWIQGKDDMDSCFILNFGYEASLPWPQVHLSLYRDFIK